MANRLHEEHKDGLARRVTRLAGKPFCDGRVNLLAGPTFLHVNTLAHPAGSTRSRRDNNRRLKQRRRRRRRLQKTIGLMIKTKALHVQHAF